VDSLDEYQIRKNTRNIESDRTRYFSIETQIGKSMKKIFFVCTVALSNLCFAWNDHPDILDHHYADLIFKLAEIQCIPEELKTSETKEKETKIIKKILKLKAEDK